MHVSLQKMCTLVLAKSFALFLAKNFAPQFLTFWNALSSHFPLPKTLHFSKQVVFFALSNGVIDKGSKQQSTQSNFRLHRSSFSSKKSKIWIKLLPKTIGNRKRDCAWGCAWEISTTWENLQIEKHKSGRRSFRSPNWFVLFDLQISQVVFIPQARPHAQSLFLFPIVFGIIIKAVQKYQRFCSNVKKVAIFCPFQRHLSFLFGLRSSEFQVTCSASAAGSELCWYSED